MPEKYLRHAGLPILLRHTGPSTLPQTPPVEAGARSVVCLHDAGLQSSVFIDLLAALGTPANGGDANPNGRPLRALAFDLPGHGRSGGFDALPSISAMSDCAQQIARASGAAKPVVVGHGMGSLVALDWARRAPGSVAGVVLCGAGSALAVREEAVAYMREVTLGRASRPFDPRRLAAGGSPDLMRRAWFESIQTDPRATLGDLEACRGCGSDFASAASALPPVLVVCGESQPEAERESASALASRLGARRESVGQAGAWLPLEQPAALARAIAAFASAGEAA